MKYPDRPALHDQPDYMPRPVFVVALVAVLLITIYELAKTAI